MAELNTPSKIIKLVNLKFLHTFVPNEHSLGMSKKEKILRTALELIVKQGIQETPMSQISKVSGVAMGTIYHHFKSKNEIVNAIYIFLKQEMGNALLQEKNKSTDYKSMFFQFWSNLFEFYRRNEQAFKFLQTFSQSPLISSEAKNDGLQYYNPIIRFFQEGLQNKNLKPIDLVLLTETIHGNIISLVQIHFQQTITVNEQIIDQAINMSWNSVANKK
ncbi:TetR/AcrR family transcriptional regulator [Flavobacteriaceae bacterium F89]|uniref:TetR/AcrR family transcriptional regulator n=1 Tax=Cerina litoralis TaxID=2874477 RepID=A0AAE3EZY2_9FLAO|nr:TetR/AcrR family transcriptional regulator [Cerina litoralis]MCG2462726.1 TetR/AcrR family transcriptional regulator [Cerina litoralis]